VYGSFIRYSMPVYPGAQWVLSLPKRIRPFLPHDPRLAGDVLRVLLRGIRTTLRRGSPSATGDAQLGAVSFLHRFGSALNAHFHFHVVVLDGVFSEGDDGSVTFHEATHLTADDVLHLERTLQRRVLRLFQRRGLLDEHTVENMLTWQASGGFSLDASVRIHGSDSAGRERLLRPGTRRRWVAPGHLSRWCACVSSPTTRPGVGVTCRYHAPTSRRNFIARTQQPRAGPLPQPFPCPLPYPGGASAPPGLHKRRTAQAQRTFTGDHVSAAMVYPIAAPNTAPSEPRTTEARGRKSTSPWEPGAR
jgi:hypothetical protein